MCQKNSKWCFFFRPLLLCSKRTQVLSCLGPVSLPLAAKRLETEKVPDESVIGIRGHLETVSVSFLITTS